MRGGLSPVQARLCSRAPKRLLKKPSILRKLAHFSSEVLSHLERSGSLCPYVSIEELMDNRHALIVDCRVTQVVGTGERDAAKTKSLPKE
jgi:hypothetical protein